MVSKIRLANFVLGGLLLLLLCHVLGTWTETRVYTPPVINPPKRSGDQFFTAALITAVQKHGYEIIAAKNLFAPGRLEETAAKHEDAPEAKPGAKTEPAGTPETVQTAPQIVQAPPPVEITLCGTIIRGEERYALIRRPRTDGQSQAFDWLKTGDHVQDLELSKIGPDKIWLRDNGKIYEVPLYDQENTGRYQRGADRPGAFQKNIATTGKKVVTVGGGDARPPAKEKTGNSETGSEEVEGEYRLIHTPFGTMKKRIEK